MLTFSSPLIEGKLIKRYKRFFADVELANGDIVTAHCANTGSMKTCGQPGDTVFVLHAPSPTRKLAYTWELTKTPKGFVGVNTARPNHIVAKAIENQKIPELVGYSEMKQEVKYGANSRIDILLSCPKKGLCYVEVKNTTLLEGDVVLFPDAVSSRGLKHLQELTQMVKEGHRAVMFYLVNRAEGSHFTPASKIDPAYSKGLKEAVKAGVEILAYRANHSLSGICIGQPLPLKDWN
jgi:sugar fermentation stimulation protein A